MPEAFVISIGQSTAGLLTAERKGFRFEASHPRTRTLDSRCFASPVDAQEAVTKLISQRLGREGDDITCRPLF
jgi:hypothetical protein